MIITQQLIIMIILDAKLHLSNIKLPIIISIKKLREPSSTAFKKWTQKIINDQSKLSNGKRIFWKECSVAEKMRKVFMRIYAHIREFLLDWVSCS